MIIHFQFQLNYLKDFLVLMGLQMAAQRGGMRTTYVMFWGPTRVLIKAILLPLMKVYALTSGASTGDSWITNEAINLIIGCIYIRNMGKRMH